MVFNFIIRLMIVLVVLVKLEIYSMLKLKFLIISIISIYTENYYETFRNIIYSLLRIVKCSTYIFIKRYRQATRA